MKTIYYKQIDSTNKAAKEMLRAGHTVPFCLVAERQTAGVGRLGRKFWSPLGGVYMTLVLPAKNFKHKFGTGYVAVCLVNVIKKYTDKHVLIKWVNDIKIDGKKVAGILVEAVAGSFVIGVGVNIKQNEKTPDELESIIGFLDSDSLDTKTFAKELASEIATLSLDDIQVIEHYKRFCDQNLDINIDGSINLPDGSMQITAPS